MCNLYSITTNQAAIAGLFRVMNRYAGNLPPMPGVFPDYTAPVVRNAGDDRELIMMRWGMPPPPRTAARWAEARHAQGCWRLHHQPAEKGICAAGMASRNPSTVAGVARWTDHA